MNKVTLIGRMVKDPELKNTPSGVPVVSFTLAVDRRFKVKGEERQADFINIVAWRSTAEFIAKYFTKGQQCALCGSLQARSYEDKDGKKQYVTEVVADEVYFAGSKKQTTGEPVQQESSDFEMLPNCDDDELPF